MLVAGLTGGIGSGKSTFARFLSERGAEVIDADQLGRSALDPGEPAWHSTVDQFGDEILAAASLDIDRKRLAAIVFNDPTKLAALNAIVHPVITRGIADTLEALSGTDEIVILDAALIVELGLDKGLDALIVVTAPEKDRRRRLQSSRAMSDEDITARIMAQTSEEELVKRADIVVRNDGTEEALTREADRVWAELKQRRDG
ncbi:MAG: dephospho-CoA kinase [Actinomycetota bacterium]|jgi:dephospho-CoA kinase|nr:dephospho-CoA kinase [Actinomycetota bacterium]